MSRAVADPEVDHHRPSVPTGDPWCPLHGQLPCRCWEEAHRFGPRDLQPSVFQPVDAAELAKLRDVADAARAFLHVGPTCCHAADGEHCDCYAPATWSCPNDDEWCDEHKPDGATELPWAEASRRLLRALVAAGLDQPTTAQVLALAAATRREDLVHQGLERIYDEIDATLRGGDFAKVDAFLAALDVTQLLTIHTLAVVSITDAAHEHLPSRTAFVARVRRHFEAVAPDRVDGLLDGFKTGAQP